MKRLLIQKGQLSVTARIVRISPDQRTASQYPPSKGRFGSLRESRRFMSSSVTTVQGVHKRSARTAVPRFTPMTQTILKHMVCAWVVLLSAQHSSQQRKSGVARL